METETAAADADYLRVVRLRKELFGNHQAVSPGMGQIIIGRSLVQAYFLCADASTVVRITAIYYMVGATHATVKMAADAVADAKLLTKQRRT